jgi:hypothetical protein
MLYQFVQTNLYNRIHLYQFVLILIFDTCLPPQRSGYTSFSCNFLAARETRLAGMIGSTSSSSRRWEEAPTAVVVFLPALRQEGYFDLDGMEASVVPCPTAAARLSRFLGLFSAVVGRSGAGGSSALPVGSAMAAGKATVADNLIFFNDFVPQMKERQHKRQRQRWLQQRQ